jgi:hypothetical protein
MKYNIKHVLEVLSRDGYTECTNELDSNRECLIGACIVWLAKNGAILVKTDIGWGVRTLHPTSHSEGYNVLISNHEDMLVSLMNAIEEWKGYVVSEAEDQIANTTNRKELP